MKSHIFIFHCKLYLNSQSISLVSLRKMTLIIHYSLNFVKSRAWLNSYFIVITVFAVMNLNKLQVRFRLQQSYLNIQVLGEIYVVSRIASLTIYVRETLDVLGSPAVKSITMRLSQVTRICRKEAHLDISSRRS